MFEIELKSTSTHTLAKFSVSFADSQQTKVSTILGAVRTG